MGKLQASFNEDHSEVHKDRPKILYGVESKLGRLSKGPLAS